MGQLITGLAWATRQRQRAQLQAQHDILPAVQHVMGAVAGGQASISDEQVPRAP